jgi:hypothetical protein
MYEVTLYADGLVEYNGQVGHRTAHLPPERFQDLVRKLHEIRFSSLADHYRSKIFDLPTTFVTVQSKRGQKTVEDYVGAPDGLHELEDLIDDVGQAKQWVGKHGDPKGPGRLANHSPTCDDKPERLRQSAVRSVFCNG